MPVLSAEWGTEQKVIFSLTSVWWVHLTKGTSSTHISKCQIIFSDKRLTFSEILAARFQQSLSAALEINKREINQTESFCLILQGKLLRKTLDKWLKFDISKHHKQCATILRHLSAFSNPLSWARSSKRSRQIRLMYFWDVFISQYKDSVRWHCCVPHLVIWKTNTRTGSWGSSMWLLISEKAPEAAGTEEPSHRWPRATQTL